jgi:hypothetical protein
MGSIYYDDNPYWSVYVMIDKCYEQPSVKHGRFWLCQFIAAFVALCIYLTRIGVIVWQ